MKIEKVQVVAATAKGKFGFEFEFTDHLNIIKAGNAHGKSTAFNSIVYALGMEELIGGRGPTMLPSSVREELQYDGSTLKIAESEVNLQLRNAKGARVVFRRAIRGGPKSDKLVEIFEGVELKDLSEAKVVRNTFLHDPGGARSEVGFHSYLASFLGLKLPLVPATRGGEVPLYLQTLFSAFTVEQKRGWSDYMANLPFYGIRDPRKKVVEFLLGLDVFSLDRSRAQLEKTREDLRESWLKLTTKINSEVENFGGILAGVPRSPTSTFRRDEARLGVSVRGDFVNFLEYMESLEAEIRSFTRSSDISLDSDASGELATTLSTLKSLSSKMEEIEERAIFRTTHLHEVRTLRSENESDLKKNKSAAKLLSLGANLDIRYSSGQCPTCGQTVDDTLVPNPSGLPVMGIEENVIYLEAQSKMLRRQEEGLVAELRNLEIARNELNEEIVNQRSLLRAARANLSATSRSDREMLRQQIQIEAKFERLGSSHTKIYSLMAELEDLSDAWGRNFAAIRDMPIDRYAEEDRKKIATFQSKFRENARKFSYRSANVSDIEISLDNLAPILGNVELKQYRSDMRSDSSASDFVRLIWSYLIAIFQCNSRKNSDVSHHAGILMLDEPGQHSMSVESQRALFLTLGSERGLQSIVAASFDEDETVFERATEGASFSLLSWDGFLMKPLSPELKAH